MPTVVPIKDMRDTAAFAELVETSPTPVTVTRNGYGRFVVMRVADYDALVEDRARERLMARIAMAERERAEHEGRDALEAVRDIRESHGL